MSQANYQKIIESLSIEFIQAFHIEVTKSITIKNEKNINNRLIILHRGNLIVENSNEKVVLKPGSIYFFPVGSVSTITYGSADSDILEKVKTDDYSKEYFNVLETLTSSDKETVFSTIDFSVKAYNAIDFFRFIELPSFGIEKRDVIYSLVENTLEENQSKRIGKQQLIKSNIIAFAVLLIRYIVEKNLFLEKIGFKIDALMDKRLVDVFCYISDNLTGDLSNQSIAEKVGLSKDYVGQFFKKITQMNLQEYIQYVRINKAIEIITTTNRRIGDISKEVGVKDFAYFCRMFKRVVGISAKQMQKRSERTSNKRERI